MNEQTRLRAQFLSHGLCLAQAFLSLGTGTQVWSWWLSLVGLKLGEDGGVEAQEAVILEPQLPEV